MCEVSCAGVVLCCDAGGAASVRPAMVGSGGNSNKGAMGGGSEESVSGEGSLMSMGRGGSVEALSKKQKAMAL